MLPESEVNPGGESYRRSCLIHYKVSTRASRKALVRNASPHSWWSPLASRVTTGLLSLEDHLSGE